MEGFNFFKKTSNSTASQYNTKELIDFKKEAIGIFKCDVYSFDQKKIDRINQKGGLPFSVAVNQKLIEFHFDPRPGIEFNSQTIPQSFEEIKKYYSHLPEQTIIFGASWIAEKFEKNGFKVRQLSNELANEFAASLALELDGRHEQEFIERYNNTQDQGIQEQVAEMKYRFDKYEEAFSKKKPTLNDIKIAWTTLGELNKVNS
jgi:hypothetical protein